ncbi:MAG: hypothetical protein F6K36_17420 [Symploca sp. SIO3C6]|nr:hypothetical protein [Symploca sp. SIO3C6]
MERLGEDTSVDHERIARTLEALEYKRSEILQELEPRRPRSYRILARMQDSARVLLASQAEKDYEKLQKIVTNLVIFTRTRQPSPSILSEIINKLSVEIVQSKNQISPYRLRLAYGIDELLRVLSAKIALGSDESLTGSNEQSLINELRSQISLLSEEFINLLRTKQEDANEINRRIRENFSLTKNISNLHRDISNRDDDIVALRKNVENLTRLAQEKQGQINSLQNSISDLQRDAQKIDQRKQSQIDYLQDQLSQLNQQELDLQKIIKNLENDAQNKNSEISELLSQISQLTYQKSDLQEQYHNLYQDYQQRQNEIISLEEKIKNLSTQQPVPETRQQITPEEYQRIVNQDDYVFVRAHTRKNGSHVKAHYRRRPNR